MMERIVELLTHEKRLLALPALLLLINGLVWVGWGLGSRRSVRDLEEALRLARERHRIAGERLAHLERLWQDAFKVREATARLYAEGFGTEPARWTQMVRRIREIATQAGLDPRSVSYPAEELVEHGLVRRAVIFAVEGDYRSLRTFLHLLEMEPFFVVVQQLAVSERSQGRLELSIRLASYFGRAVVEDAAARPELPGRGVGGVP
jgi:Tfp pilus assembly protein PilO